MGLTRSSKAWKSKQRRLIIGEKNYKGLYLPQLSLNASYAHLSDPLSLSFDKYKQPIQAHLGQMGSTIPAPMRPMLAPIFTQMMGRLQPLFAQEWRYQFQEQDIWKVSADLRWVLFAGGKVRVGNKVGQINHEIAKV